MIQYPGATRDMNKAVIGETVADSGGVHFINKYGQIQEIDRHVPSALLKNLLKQCARKKWSETSSNHLLTEFDGYDQKYDLAIATVELISMNYVGRMLCE